MVRLPLVDIPSGRCPEGPRASFSAWHFVARLRKATRARQMLATKGEREEPAGWYSGFRVDGRQARNDLLWRQHRFSISLAQCGRVTRYRLSGHQTY